MRTEKTCKECQQALPFEDFRLVKKRGGLWRQACCKECTKKRSKAWKEANKDRVKAWHEKWWSMEENRAKSNARRKQWSIANPEQKRGTQRRYIARNPEKCSARTKMWQKANPEKIIGYQAKQYFKASDISDPPIELLNLKASHIKVTRELKSIKKSKTPTP